MLPSDWIAVDYTVDKHPLYRVVISQEAADLALDCDELITLGRISPVVFFARIPKTKIDKIRNMQGYTVTAVTDEQAMLFDQFTKILDRSVA